jgi:hypothetical protein
MQAADKEARLIRRRVNRRTNELLKTLEEVCSPLEMVAGGAAMEDDGDDAEEADEDVVENDAVEDLLTEEQQAQADAKYLLK